MLHKLKDKSYYESLKTRFNNKHASVWQTINHRNYVGNCSYLFKKYRPKDYEDFFQKYINDYSYVDYDTDTCKGSHYVGRSYEQLTNLAHIYHKTINDNSFTLEDCLDDIINHVIIETFDGHIVENRLCQMLINSGYMVENQDDNYDTKYGIDIVAVHLNNKNDIHYIQVKPISFFIGSKNQSLIYDRKKRIISEFEFKGTLTSSNVRDIEYVMYDKKELDTTGKVKIADLNGKKRFALYELINSNGIPLYNKTDFTFVNL